MDIFSEDELSFPEDEWTTPEGEKWTREQFLDKLEWEGGIEGMISWGGAGCFPPSLRESAETINRAMFE